MNSEYAKRNKTTERLVKIFKYAGCPYSDVYIWSNPELDYDILHCAIPGTDNSFSFRYADGKWHYMAECKDKWNIGICQGLNRTFPDCIPDFREQHLK